MSMDSIIHFRAAAPFEAALKIDSLPDGHRSQGLHGHSFTAKVRAPESSGMEAETLAAKLHEVVGSLSYSYLNDVIDTPTDENIARWIHARFPAESLAIAGVQSTHDEGADLDQEGNAHIWRRFRFEAAHQLPNVAPGHQCGRMHGHGFEVIIHVQQQLSDQESMGVDYEHIDLAWAPLHAQLNFACLNDISGLENPTSEVISAWIWEILVGQIPGLSWVSVYETATAGCHYDGSHYRIWKESRFEAALTLPEAIGDKRKLHGHSYLVRLHLSAPLDQILGWTVDYGDVKEMFKPTYDQLDHHDLDSVSGMGDPTLKNMLHWMRARTEPVLPQLNRIDLYQTPGCGAGLSWGELGPALPV